MKSLNVENLISICGSMFSHLKAKFLFSGLISVYAFLFNPLKEQLYLAVAMLIVFDFLTALLATTKTKEKITSAKSSRTILKMLVYGILVSSATMADRFIIDQGQIFADLMLGFIAITEFISIIENVAKLGVATPVNLLKKLKKIRKEKL